MSRPTPSLIPRDGNNALAYFASGTTIISGRKVSTTPGTPVSIVNAATPCQHVVIYAYIGNAGTIAVGDSINVLAEPNTNNKTGLGEQLIQGAATTLHVVDASLVYLDVANSGDGISYSIYS